MNQLKSGSPKYKIGDIVYIVAFLKGEQGKWYPCQAEVTNAPPTHERQLYRVKITAVSDRPVGGSPTPTQATLLGRIITKRENEISLELPEFMMPSNWIIFE